MALAALALELVYLQRVLAHLGVVFDQPAQAQSTDPEAHALIARVTHSYAGTARAETDSKAAHDLCKRDSAGSSTRHVERREFKMRELQKRGKVDLKLVRTHEMYADCMTKLVDLATFQRCRSVLLNLPAAGL